MSKADLESPQIPSSLVEASCRLGWHMADEAIKHIENVGILQKGKRQKKPVSFSPEILMELSAILRLGSWLEGGLCDFLKDEEVSAAFTTMVDSEKKLTSDPQAFECGEGLPPLTTKIFEIWEKHLAWSAREELDVDLLLDLSEMDDGAVLQNLADFLWEHRHTEHHQPGS